MFTTRRGYLNTLLFSPSLLTSFPLFLPLSLSTSNSNTPSFSPSFPQPSHPFALLLSLLPTLTVPSSLPLPPHFRPFSIPPSLPTSHFPSFSPSLPPPSHPFFLLPSLLSTSQSNTPPLCLLPSSSFPHSSPSLPTSHSSTPPSFLHALNT